jgi:hypothetical protein
MKMSEWRLGVFLLSAACGPIVSAVDEAPVRVVLPPFEVTAMRDDLGWEYGAAEGAEVLTLCSRSYSRDFAEALLRARQLVPREFLAEWSTPPAVVLIDLNVAKLAVAPAAVRQAPGLSRLGLGWYGAQGFITNSDNDSLVVAGAVRDEPAIGRVLVPWLNKSFWAAAPAHAAWLREGLFGTHGLFFELGRYPREDRMRVASLLWVNEQQTDALKRADTPDPHLLPWDKFFNGPPPDRAQQPEEFELWRSQAVLFCRWALLADKVRPTEVDAFWRWAYAAGRHAVMEDEFRRVFGYDYVNATRAMLAYLRVSVREPQDFSIPGLHARRTAVSWKFRPATEAEVARLKGNFERMEAARLRADFPELAARYEATARRTLERGLKRSGADPSVRAVLGLLEYDTGHLDEARPHLEAAFAAKVASTRALLALARLRWADMRIGLPPDGKLSIEALDRVLTPLYVAKDRRPAEVEVYRLLAEIWGESALTPKLAHLAVLMEGLALFPDDAELLWLAADVHRRFGYRAEAVAFARRGEQITTPGSAERARFAALLAKSNDGGDGH